MTPAPSLDRKIEDIQALRGISILLVLMCHLQITTAVFTKFYHKIEVPFFLGVEMFFLISGYVVTLALFKDQFNGVRFLIKRVFRLTPVLLIFVAVSYGVVLAVRAVVPGSAEHFSYFAPNEARFFHEAGGILGGYYLLIDGRTSFQNGAMWSLSVEDQFYATIAILCVFGVLVKRVTRIPVQWWVGLLSAVVLTTLLWMRIRYFRGKTPSVFWQGLLGYMFRWRFEFLALGVLLAMFDRSIPGKIRAYFQQRGPFLTGFLLVIPLGLASLCESMFSPERRLLFGLAMPVTLVCFGMLVLLAGNNCAFPSTRSHMYRVLVWIGNRSYTYYVFHFPVLLFTYLICFKWHAAALWPPMRWGKWQAAIAIPLLVLLAEPIYRWVEMPITRFGKRLVDGRRHTPNSSASSPSVDSTPLKIAA